MSLVLLLLLLGFTAAGARLALLSRRRWALGPMLVLAVAVYAAHPQALRTPLPGLLAWARQPGVAAWLGLALVAEALAMAALVFWLKVRGESPLAPWWRRLQVGVPPVALPLGLAGASVWTFTAFSGVDYSLLALALAIAVVVVLAGVIYVWTHGARTPEQRLDALLPVVAGQFAVGCFYPQLAGPPALGHTLAIDLRATGLVVVLLVLGLGLGAWRRRHSP